MTQAHELARLREENARLRWVLYQIMNGPLMVAGPPIVASACQALHRVIADMARAALAQRQTGSAA